jgi:hypothetical protein
MSKQEFTFDKFMDDLIRKEQERQRELKERSDKKGEIHPQRKINQLYRERWQNRIRWGRK